MIASTRRRVLLATTLAGLVVVAACSDDTGKADPPTTAPIRTSTTQPIDDGVLHIGVLLPSTGAGASLGEPLIEAVDLAAAEINAAGGVNGVAVQVTNADEGESVATAMKAVAELRDAGVDAVVGPASSRVALSVLGGLVEDGVFTCSPTATAISLTEFPDARHFARTIPSDSLQAVAMAEATEDAGVASAAVMAPDDDYGRPFARSLASALTRRGIAVTSQVLYQVGDGDPASAVLLALEGEPGAIALVGTTTTGRQMLATVDDLVPAGLPVVVNDSLRRATSVDAFSPVGTNADISGTSPRASAAPNGASWFNPVFATFLGVDAAAVPPSFAANAYDCVSLIALAAQAAGVNDATAIVQNVLDVSSGGASCGNFVTCRDFLAAGRNIDLNGASGPLELDAAGDVSVGWFDRFRFDEQGRDVTVSELQVTGN